MSLLRLTLDHFVGRRGKFFRWFWLGVYPSSGRHLVLWFWVSLRVGAEFEFLNAPIHPPSSRGFRSYKWYQSLVRFLHTLTGSETE